MRDYVSQSACFNTGAFHIERNCTSLDRLIASALTTPLHCAYPGDGVRCDHRLHLILPIPPQKLLLLNQSGEPYGEAGKWAGIKIHTHMPRQSYAKPRPFLS